MQPTLATCKARRQANPVRAHSAAARCPDAVIEAEDDDLLALVPIFGELVTRVSALGCSGEFGKEVDRRREPRSFVLRISFEDAGRFSGGCFIASPRALRVELMTSVARTYFSLGVSCCCSGTTSFSCTGAFAPRLPILDGVFARDFAVIAFGLIADFVSVDEVGGGGFDFGRSKSLRSVAIAGVHVDVDFTALLMESAFSCNEAIAIVIMA